jgi:Mn2+/Fe2+ NRAMP family transporter
LGVLLFGACFGIAGVQPIPAIILAQAFNGLLLPVAAVFLWLTMNDRRLLGDRGVNTRFQNLLMGLIVVTCVALGLRGLAAAARGIIDILGG